ncbi:MAG TPA: tetratricopeptide repeat protein [Gemmataceae bacterium]|nr:tetratricopeptide repeat protein [Gemmataceae bacterium]
MLAAAVVGAAAFAWLRPKSPELSLRTGTSYRNTIPDVRYMGDASCAACHPVEAKSYHQHPMGRSFARIDANSAREKEEASAGNAFRGLGFEFAVASRPIGLVHIARGLAPDDRAVVSSELPIQYVVGSGTRGRSYLSDRDGYLFQSPISWFSQKQAWDLSPRFEFIYPPDRIVEPSCLFCHANDAASVPQSRNRYREPIFHSYAIGCERCHGPGELHVALRERGAAADTGDDDTIVNPRRLPASLREAVCQQCHLQGKQRFLRFGQDTFGYRPGLALHDFWAIFVDAESEADSQRAVGQVEQMYASRCFRQSAAAMGCISCHDPHALPEPTERVSYFRDRCLRCHASHPCTEDMSVRREQQDSCMACHMPRLATSDIAHTAITDHRILRRPSHSGRPASQGTSGELVSFFEDVLGPDDGGKARDLGVALSYQTKRPEPGRAQKAVQAAPMLQKATLETPDDVVAWEALGWALTVQGQGAAALSTYEEVLARQPQRELTLTLGATAAERAGRNEQALGYWRRLVELNPWIWDYHYNLGKLLAEKQDWKNAVKHCEAAIRLHPTSEPTRLLLITCYLRNGQRSPALEQFAKAVALNPKDEKVLKDWFVQQSAR